MRAAARSLAVLAALGVFYAAAAYAHGGHSKAAGPTGSLHVSMSGKLGLDDDVSDVAPGDTIARTATLENRGKGAIGAIALSVDATAGSGLQIRVDRCATPWKAGTDQALRCAGRVSEIVGWRPLAASRSPWQLGSLLAKSTAYLRVSLLLPEAASAKFSGRHTTLDYRFTAQ